MHIFDAILLLSLLQQLIQNIFVIVYIAVYISVFLLRRCNRLYEYTNININTWINTL